MRHEPPAHLVTLLHGLGLGDLRGMRAVRPRVRRLARDLPAFDQVWIDALVQARRITPFQATLLSQENAAKLKVGPFVLVDRLGRSDLGETYVARPAGRGRPVALKVLDPALVPADSAAGRLEPVLKKLAVLKARHLAVPTQWGVADGRFYIASPWVCGPNAGEILIHFGRVPPGAVAEVARQLLAGLLALWSRDLTHGDIRPSHLRVARNGKVVLTDACTRLALPEASLLGVRRLPPERFDYLSPESFESGQASMPTADQYALGCLLWHLLAGRAPFPGADADAKRVARQRRDVPDVREHAPATPAALASLIAALTRRESDERPKDYAALLRSLDRRSGAGRRQLARYGKALGRRWRHRRRSRVRWLVAGAAGAVAAAAVALAVSVEGEPAWRDALARWSHGRQGGTPAVAEPVLPTGEAMVQNDPAQQRTIETVAGAIRGAEALVLREPVYRVQGGYLKPPGQPGRRLALYPGQRIVGARRPAPVLVLEDGALRITETGVQWENLRFVLARTAGEADREPDPLAVVTAPGCRFHRCTFEVQQARHWPAALVVLQGVSAGFESCTFEGPADSAQTLGTQLPAAVDWQPTPEPGNAPAQTQPQPPGVELTDCTLHALSSGVVVAADDVPDVALRRTTFTGPGALVRLVVHEASRGRVTIQLADCTTYNARAVLDVAYGRVPSDWPGCSLSAENCEFHFEQAPSETAPLGALVSFRGTEPTEALLRKVHWSGTGSAVIAPEPIPAAAWDRGDQTLELPRPLVEQLPIDGITWGRLPPRRAEDAGAEP